VKDDFFVIVSSSWLKFPSVFWFFPLWFIIYLFSCTHAPSLLPGYYSAGDTMRRGRCVFRQIVMNCFQNVLSCVLMLSSFHTFFRLVMVVDWIIEKFQY
jgi:cellulose synthase/poly-beta-1,6-N-acetylglucosamine synthase-like glycosyltransferase